MTDHSAALDAVECLRGREREVEELPGGLTNVNLKVTTAEQTVVVRIAQSGSELLDIDREAEHLNSVAAAEAGVGAPVIEYVARPRAARGRLHRGAHLHRRRPPHRRPSRDGSLPPASQLHDGSALRQRLRHVRHPAAATSRIVRDEGYRLPDRYDDFADKAEQIRRAFAVRPTPTVPCNNDLLAGNFIDDGEKLWLIDYEYGGNNDPCFELGNLWSEPNLTSEQLEELMEAYDGQLLRHRVARARLWALMSKYGWTLWGSIQSSVSTIDFDFWEWAMEKYDRAVAEFDGPDFDRLLEQAAGDD